MQIAMDTFQDLRNLASANKAKSQTDYIYSSKKIYTFYHIHKQYLSSGLPPNMKFYNNLWLKECSVSFANKLVSHNLHQV